jgi:hypothetical protein
MPVIASKYLYVMHRIRFSRNACFIAAMAVLFTLAACKMKKDDNTTPDDTGYATDHAMLEKTFNDVQSIADEAGTSGNLSTFRSGPATLGGPCATVTCDTISVPHVLTIDFGATNCLCQDGNYRRGQIIITYNGHYRDSGYAHAIGFNNYFVNDNQVTGTKTVTNMGHNSSGQPYYNVSVNGSIILANNNGTISWTSTRTRTWVAGYNTTQWADDVYNITGSASVTRANGNTFSLNITSPLVIALNCHWIEQGTVQITRQNGNIRTLDYGNGTCDALATFTVNGHTYNITLH